MIKKWIKKILNKNQPVIEFVDYTGEYPCLCSGTLTIKVNGKEYKIEGLRSGGRVWFDDNWGDHVETGPWSIALPEEIRQYKDEIEEIVNEKVPWGCCGGCI